METNKPLEPDFTKKKFEIVITVYENCHTTSVKSFDDYNPSYHEIVGVLEIQKAMYMYDQSLYNRKLFKKKGKKV